MKTTMRDSLEGPNVRASGSRGWQVSLVNHAEMSRIGATAQIQSDGLLLGRIEGAFDGVGDDRVSRRHAQLGLGESGVKVSDLGSSNGTYVNGRRLEEPERVSAGDLIRVGSTLLLVQRTDERRGRSRHGELAGASPAVVDVIEQLERVAPRKTTVLLLGETGTGKELAARALHRQSDRAGSFCAVNCSAVSDNLIESELFGHEQGAFSGASKRRVGLAEAADGGTLFLDEVGDASAGLQASLLRFLQEGEVRRVGSVKPIAVDVRVIAATHRDLLGSSFRDDLYARLARIVIELPPLRERIEDVPQLARRFVREFGRAEQFFDWRLMDAMLRYHWPRNVRELQAFVEAAVIEAGAESKLRLTPPLRDRLNLSPANADTDTDTDLAPADPRRRTRALRPSADELRALLEKHEGNVSAVAGELGAGRNSVYRWMKSAGLELDDFRGSSDA